jgi:PAS domain S-box-containing protein
VDHLQQGHRDREEKESQYQDIFDSMSDGVIISDLKTGRVLEANPAALKMHGYTHMQLIGLDLTTLIHPESRKIFSEYFRGIQADSAFDTRILHVRPDDSTFHAEWHGTVFTYQGLPCLLSVIRDVSKRIQAEQLLHQHVELRTHEQATLLQISRTLASTLELQPGLILDQVRTIIEYTHGVLFRLEDSTLVALAMRGTPQLEQSPPIRIQLNSAEDLVVLFNGHRPIHIANIWSDKPEAQFLRALLEDDAAALLEGVTSWMWAPLAVRGRIIGGMGLTHMKPNYFTSHQADLALSVANKAAITMMNSELYGQAQALAVLEERQRLARNLHDAVNQSLFSAGLIAEVLPRLWEQNQEEARQSLKDLRRLTRGALAEMRTLLGELRPATITDSDLGELLELLGNALSGRTNLPVDVHVEKRIILPPKVQVAFYRICQEALYNVTKHAKASQVAIHLSQEGDVVELRVRDDGLGFDPEQSVAGHYGLSMMRERAEAVGVELNINSQPGQGTELIIRWTSGEKKETL